MKFAISAEKFIYDDVILLCMALSQNQIKAIIQLRGMGYTQQEIADELGISKRTVQNHLRQIREQADEADDRDELFWNILIGAGALALLSKIFGNRRP